MTSAAAARRLHAAVGAGKARLLIDAWEFANQQDPDRWYALLTGAADRLNALAVTINDALTADQRDSTAVIDPAVVQAQMMEELPEPIQSMLQKGSAPPSAESVAAEDAVEQINDVHLVKPTDAASIIQFALAHEDPGVRLLGKALQNAEDALRGTSARSEASMPAADVPVGLDAAVVGLPDVSLAQERNAPVVPPPPDTAVETSAVNDAASAI